MAPAGWKLANLRLPTGQRCQQDRGRGKGWRQEQLVLLEEGHQQIMHRIVSIDGCEDIASGHLLSEREERLKGRVQLLGKARRKLLLELNQQAGNNHPEKNPVRVGDLWAGLLDNAHQFLKGAHGSLTAFQYCRVNAPIARRRTPGDTHPFDLTVASLQIAAALGG